MKRTKLIAIVPLFLFWTIASCSNKNDKAAINGNGNMKRAPLRDQDASAESFDFRRVTWGMTREQVKATESTGPTVSDCEMIGYQTVVGRRDAFCTYGFVDDRLAIGMYQFKDLHTNKNEYFEDFAELKKMLTEKYGVTKVDEVEWKDKMFKKDPENWGLAVATGGLKYRAKWETETTDILLLLYGDKYDITLMVRYDSRELRPLFDEAAKKQGRSDF